VATLLACPTELLLSAHALHRRVAPDDRAVEIFDLLGR